MFKIFHKLNSTKTSAKGYFLPIFREISKFKLSVQIIKIIENVWSVNIMVLHLLGGIGYSLYWIFTMYSPKFKSKNIDLKDIGNNH